MNKKSLIAIIIAVIAVLVGVFVFITTSAKNPDRELKLQLDLGARYLQENNYEQAIAAFDVAISIDPKCSEAYIGLANTYVAMAKEAIASGDTELAMGYYDMAIEVLERGINETDDDQLKDLLEDIKQDIGNDDGEIKEPQGDVSSDNTEVSNIPEATIKPIVDLATIEGESILQWDCARLVEYYGLNVNSEASDENSTYYESERYAEVGHSCRIYHTDSWSSFDWRDGGSVFPSFRAFSRTDNSAEIEECLLVYEGSRNLSGLYYDYALANNVVDGRSFLKSLGLTDDIIDESIQKGTERISINTEYGVASLMHGDGFSEQSDINDFRINVTNQEKNIGIQIWIQDWSDGLWLRVQLTQY